MLLLNEIMVAKSIDVQVKQLVAELPNTVLQPPSPRLKEHGADSTVGKGLMNAPSCIRGVLPNIFEPVSTRVQRAKRRKKGALA